MLAWQRHTVISEILELVRITENVREIEEQNIFLSEILKLNRTHLTNKFFADKKYGTRSLVMVFPLAPVVVV